MDDAIQNIPEAGLRIGITTTGRKSGRPHRRDVRLYSLDGRFYITGSPGRRDWYANLLADTRFTVHLKGESQTILDATAYPIREASGRLTVLSLVHSRRGGRLGKLDEMLKRSPLVQVHFDN